MGWDDTGLPTERRVQNHFNVRVDLHVPYEPGIDVSQSPEKSKVPPRLVSRPNFIEFCHRVTADDERAFKDLFQRIGLSVDWREEYATIDARCRRIAQRSFLDLHAKGHVYSVTAAPVWERVF